MSNLRLIGLGAVLLTSSLCGVLIAGAPGVRQLPPLQLPFGDPPVELGWLLIFQVGSILLAGLVFAIPKMRVLLYSYLVLCISWSLVGSTRFPWWLLQSASNPLRESPEAGTILLVGLAVTSLLQYLLVEALETYRKAAVERGVDAAIVRQDLKKIAIHYLSLCAVALVIGLFLLAILDRFVADAGWAPQLSGDAWGAWILLLIGALLAGVLLILGRIPGSERKAQVPSLDLGAAPVAAPAAPEKL